MYKVVCHYYDVLFGSMSYVVEEGLTLEVAEVLANSNSEYSVQPMESPK